jgi:hypothetical protein
VSEKLPRHDWHVIRPHTDFTYWEPAQSLVDRQAEIIATQAERIKALEDVNSQKLLDENKRIKALLSETRGHLQGRKMSMLASTPERLLEKIEAALKGE